MLCACCCCVDSHCVVFRKQQLLECEEVLESFETHGRGGSNVDITREALERGLLIPQDRPKVGTSRCD